MKQYFKIQIACMMILSSAIYASSQITDDPPSPSDNSCTILDSDSTTIQFKHNGVTFNFKKVEGGDVNLGPFGRQHIDTFWIMETEMTCNLFSKFYNSANASSKECVDYSQQVYSKFYIDYGEMPILLYDDYKSDGNYVTMAINSTYFKSIHAVEDILSFLNNVFEQFTFSIPTAQQWLYAARGGSMSGDYLYSGSDNINEVAWYSGNSQIYRLDGRYSYAPHQVMQKNPNELGLYDMCGNAAEMVDAKIISSRVCWYDKGPYAPNDESYLVTYSHIVCCGGDAKTDADKCHPSLAEQRQEFMTYRLVLVPKQ